MADTKVTVEGGKYTFVVTGEGRVVCDRFGDRDWVAFEQGSKALISLIHHAAELEERAGEREASEKSPSPVARMFPIYNGDHGLGLRSVPWAFLAPHEAQAVKSHDQDLESLARCGGLGIKEMLAVVEGRRCLDYEMMTDQVAADLLRNRLATWTDKQLATEKPIPLEDTPLGIARKAIDAAQREIEAEIDRWSEEGPPYDKRCPGGEYELRLEPDSGSLGFALVLEYHDDAGDDPGPIVERLQPLLEKHGIVTVHVLGHTLDSADVKAFSE